MTKKAPIRERFWEKVDQRGPDECWPWLASTTSHGYGTLRLWPTGALTAHRVAYELAYGEIPEGLTIDHLCRNRICCNPYHLEAVSLHENILRGNGRSAINARKTHCIRGHRFSAENTYITPNGRRQRRTCKRERTCG